MKKIILLPLHTLTLLALVLVASPDSRAQALSGFGSTASADELKSYPFEKRAEFTASIKTIAARLDSRITGLSARAAAESASRPGLSKAVEQARVAREELESEIGKIPSAKAETWESTRDGVLTALARVESACEQATKA